MELSFTLTKMVGNFYLLFNSTFPVGEKLEYLIKIGYLENPIQLGVYSTDDNFAVMFQEPGSDV